MEKLCIPNISTEERRKRLKSGLMILIVSLALLIVLVATGLNPWWRLLLFPLFAAAASSYFQWRDKT